MTTNNKRPMNKGLGNIIFKVLFAALLLTSNAAMAQRESGNEGGSNTSVIHVTVGDSIFGGGNKANVKGSCSVSITQPGCRVNGDVYGGGALAHVNVTATGSGENITYSPTSGATTTVEITHGTIGGDVYGGGLGNADTAALVFGEVTVNIGKLTGPLDEDGFAPSESVFGEATLNGSVYGCNNVNGTPRDNVWVNIYKTAHTTANLVSGSDFAIANVFGGGNHAHYVPLTSGKKPTVHIWTCDNTIEYLYGGGNAADLGKEDPDGNNDTISASDVIIDGGRIEWVFGGGNGFSATNNHFYPNQPNYNPGANIVGDASVTFHAGFITYLFGGSNEWGNITGTKNVSILNDGVCVEENHHIVELYAGNNKAPISGGGANFTMPCPTANDPCLIEYIFGGSREADITGNVELNIYGGLYNYVFGGNNIGGTISGNVTLNLYGGTINEAAFGGNKGGGSITGNITVNVEDQCACPLQVKDVFGAGDQAMYTPSSGNREFNPMVNVNNICGTNTITGNVYGGGNGDPDNADQEPGMVTGNPKVIIGDLTTGNESYRAAISGNVFGGGNAAKVVGKTTVLMQKDNSIVGHDIYGGGNLANVSGSTVVNVTGGTVTQDVYGGGALADVNVTDGVLTPNATTSVTVTGGTVRDVYGGGLGSNGSGNEVEAKVYGPVTVDINAGTVNDVFGCNNKNGAPRSTVNVNIEQTVGASMSVNNVYGGGNLASCGVSPVVYIKNGTVGGSVFGGGLGSTATVAGQPSVTVGDLSVVDYLAIVTGDVYGGGDMANVRGETTVLVQKCNTIINGDVYGGGNAAHILRTETNTLGTTSVTVTGGTINNYNQGHGMVFGGGHGDKDASPAVAANVAVSTSVTINGGTIYQVYGGSNSLGSINSGNSGGINVLVDKANDACDLHITELYGGGNYAASQAGNIDIRCTGTVENANEGINYVYGGANRANVTGPIELTIDEGRIDYVFGGNNNSGSITGDITVTIEKKADPCVWEVGDVFGGGNLAIYGDIPEVYVNNGTVANVFGGGKGDPTSTTQQPGQVAGSNVTIGDNNPSHCAVVTGNVYGGGNAAKVEGSTVVVYNDNNRDNNGVNNSSVNNLFGGGNMASVTGTTSVTLTDGTVHAGVYGGCNVKGNVGGNITVTVNGGTVGSEEDLTNDHVTANVHGGGYGGYLDAANPGTTTSGNVLVNINGGTIYGDVYGGSAFGDVNAGGSNTTIVNIMGGILETSIEEGTTAVGLPCNIYHGGNVFGGGLGQKEATGVTAYAAKVYGAVTVNIGTGRLDDSEPGSDYNEVTELDGIAIIKGNIYGCNNQNGSPQNNVIVNVFQTAHPEATGGYALHDVFGGGNQADFTVTGKTATVYIYTCANTIERTFSGGNAAATNSVRTMIQGGRIREVYGGGNGEVSAANVNGTATLDIHGGEIGQSYAGSNQQGTITQGSTVTADDLGPCGGGTNVNEFFCGGNYANYIGNINATIACHDRMNVDNLYGGCNQALVQGNIKLSVYGGTYKNIYGGSKGRSDLSADVWGDVTLNIFGGEVQEAIFGGCNIKGEVKGKIVVNVETIPDNECPLEISEADVYGGGNLANYDTSINEHYSIAHPDYPQINIKNATVKNVYGGGLKAEVKGNPQVRIKKGSRVLGNVYGGGNMGEVIGDPRVIINGKDNTNNPTGL